MSAGPSFHEPEQPERPSAYRPLGLEELIDLAHRLTPPIPRELHVRNRQNLVRITGAHEEANPDIPPSLPFAGLPVYCDDAMPDNVMELRHAETGEVLRRFFLTPNGELFAFNPGQMRLPPIEFTITTSWV